MSASLRSIYQKAWDDPVFFQELIQHRKNPDPVLSRHGLTLSEGDHARLKKVLGQDALRIEWGELESRLHQVLGELPQPWGGWHE